MSSTLATRRAARRPDVQEKLRHMALPLHPLVQVNTGRIHPVFPTTVLQFWLLTEDQLDALAHFYHQRTPGHWSDCYPCPVAWPREGLGLEDKRRKLGRFIGLRGCDTPALPLPKAPAADAPDAALPVCAGGDGSCALDAQPFCYPCSLRAVTEMFGTVPTTAPATATATTTTPLAKRSSSSSTRTSCYARPERPRSRSRTRARSLPGMPTVDDIIERAQLTRLAGASEEALRLKLGYYR